MLVENTGEMRTFQDASTDGGLNWPSPPPPPSPSPPVRRELSDTGFEEDAVFLNTNLEEQEMKADVRRQLQRKRRKSKLPPGARFGQCDSCPEDLSELGSELGYMCAPGVNGLFYDAKVNKDTTHGQPENDVGIPYGGFRVTTQSCDMGTLYYCTDEDIPSDPSDPTKGPCPAGSVPGVTVFQDKWGNPIPEPIEGDQLLEEQTEVQTDPNGKPIYKIDKFFPTLLSIDLFGRSFEYNPVRASTKCKCARSFTPDALNDLDHKGELRAGRTPPANADDVRAGREVSDFGLKACKAPADAAVDPRSVGMERKTHDDRLGRTYISCKAARTAPGIDAVEQCLPDAINDVTNASRTIGTQRGNLLRSSMRCAISIYTQNPAKYAKTNRVSEEQDADCKCKSPRRYEDLNAGTIVYDIDGRAQESIKGNCFEVLPTVW
jgi:hypothetical protein